MDRGVILKASVTNNYIHLNIFENLGLVCMCLFLSLIHNFRLVCMCVCVCVCLCVTYNFNNSITWWLEKD